jgi:uncharacterized protein YdeI (YjbR/CyaY-like superfamily)
MPKTSKHDHYPVREFKNAASFENWLAKNHSKAEGIWLKIAKVNSGIDTVLYAEAILIALCYGWIDGTRRSLDEDYYIQKFTPRTSKSIWSVINKKKATDLISEGKMQPSGFAAIEEAKRNGQWKKAYKSQNAITVPADLKKELEKNPAAKIFFGKLNAQNRYSIVFRIEKLKKPEARKKKIEAFIAMLEQQETIHPQNIKKE